MTSLPPARGLQRDAGQVVDEGGQGGVGGDDGKDEGVGAEHDVVGQGEHGGQPRRVDGVKPGAQVELEDGDLDGRVDGCHDGLDGTGHERERGCWACLTGSVRPVYERQDGEGRADEQGDHTCVGLQTRWQGVSEPAVELPGQRGKEPQDAAHKPEDPEAAERRGNKDEGDDHNDGNDYACRRRDKDSLHGVS